MTYNTLQTGSSTAPKVPFSIPMIGLFTAVLAILQAPAPPQPQSAREPAPTCVTCHAPAPQEAHPDSSRVGPRARPPFPYPDHYVPSGRVVVTRPRDSTLQLVPDKPARQRLVPRLVRRKPPVTRRPRVGTAGRPPVTLRR